MGREYCSWNNSTACVPSPCDNRLYSLTHFSVRSASESNPTHILSIPLFLCPSPVHCSSTNICWPQTPISSVSHRHRLYKYVYMSIGRHKHENIFSLISTLDPASSPFVSGATTACCVRTFPASTASYLRLQRDCGGVHGLGQASRIQGCTPLGVSAEAR